MGDILLIVKIHLHVQQHSIVFREGETSPFPDFFCPKMHHLRRLSTVLSFTATAGTSGSLWSPVAFLQKQHGRLYQFCGRGDQQLQWWAKTLENGTLSDSSEHSDSSSLLVLPLWGTRLEKKPLRHCNPIGLVFGGVFLLFFQRKLTFSSGKTYSLSVQNVFL